MASSAYFRERESFVRSDPMSRAWEIFRQTYGYPRIPFQSIGRSCFAWSLRKAWAERRQAEKLAGLSDAELGEIIVNTEAEIETLKYRGWGCDVQREKTRLQDAARPYVAEQFRRAVTADAMKLAA